MRNLRTMRVVYWDNVSESFGAGSPGLCRIKGREMVVVLLLICAHFHWCHGRETAH